MHNKLTLIPTQSPICETMRFSTQFSAEILRDLLLPEQRIRIHETAARVLEKKVLRYDFCCKKEFFGNVFKISAMGETNGKIIVKSSLFSFKCTTWFRI